MKYLLPLLVFFFACQTSSRDMKPKHIPSFPIDSLDYSSLPVEVPESEKERFYKSWFSPWNERELEVPGKADLWVNTFEEAEDWYSENKQPFSLNERSRIAENCRGYESVGRLGITLRTCNLRRLPTDRPGFDRPDKAGEGYPFDYFQETAIHPFCPLKVLFPTQDKLWYYVQSAFYQGWLHAEDVAFVDEDFIKTWQEGPFVMPLSDNILIEREGEIRQARIGMLMALKDSNTVWMPVKTQSGEAVLIEAKTDFLKLAWEDVPFDEIYVKTLLKALNNRPYNWGDHVGSRDCSSTLRDFMATFRVWLPRNSGDQAKQGSWTEVLPEDRKAKEDLILQKGRPFLTILAKKGHSMLYVGKNSDGEPLIFHNIWGIKTRVKEARLKDMLAKYPLEGMHLDEEGYIWGRHIIGRSLVSSVRLGEKVDYAYKPLLDEMSSISVLW
jgi:hypothetical protein